MNVRKKAILTIFILFLVALIIVIFTSQTIIMGGFQKLEYKDTTTQTLRAADALNNEVISLDTLTLNNAAWDDTYKFIQDNNIAYIDANANDQTLSAADLNLIGFINSSGQIVYMRTFNTFGNNPNSIADGMATLISNENNLWNFSSTTAYARGLTNIGGNLFLIASRPILTSDYLGPVKGAMVMGRELSSNITDSIEEQTHLQIQINSLMNNYSMPNFREVSANLPSVGSIYVKPENNSQVAGFTLIGDANGNACAILSVNLPRDIYNQGAASANTFTYLLAFLFIAFGATTMLFLEATLISRVSKLTTKVQQITSDENINQRVTIENSRLGTRDDELSLLSMSINSMLDKIQEVTGELNKSQRFAAVGELAVMIGHDLRNPLQGITAAADFLSREKISGPEKKDRALQLIKKDVQYCEKIVSDLLDYSRETRIMKEETDVHSLLFASLSHIQVPENIEINNLTTEEPKIHVDVNLLTRVFDNMIKNAIDAMPEGGSLTINGDADANSMRISFADTGQGISEDKLGKLFVPLYTTKAKGMGFGLAICKRIVTAHEGKISVQSEVGKGTKFTIEFPL